MEVKAVSQFSSSYPHNDIVVTPPKVAQHNFDRPQSLDEFLRHGDITLESGEKIPFEVALQYLLLQLIEDTTLELENREKEFKELRTQTVIIEGKQRDVHAQIRQNAESMKTTGKVHKVASSLALSIAGFEGLLGSHPILGMTSLITGALLALDRYTDDAGTKKIASWFAREDTHSKEAWVNGLNLFSQLFTAVITLNISDLSTAFQVAHKSADLGLSGFQYYLQDRHNEYTATHLTNDLALEQNKETLDKLFEKMNRLTETIQQYMTSLQEVEKERCSVIEAYCQSINN